MPELDRKFGQVLTLALTLKAESVVPLDPFSLNSKSIYQRSFTSGSTNFIEPTEPLFYRA